MNIKEKPKWLALAVVLILAVAGIAIMIEQEMGSAAVKTGDVSIADRITWAAGFNGTTTKFATLKAVGNTEYVNFTSFDPTYVVVAAGNPLYDVQGLLNTSDIYQTASISIAKQTIGGDPQAALASAYALIGVINNVTNMKVESSHAPSNIADNHTLYSSTVNNLGNQFGYNLFNLFASKFTDQQVYTMNLNYSKTTNATGSVSIAFADTLSGFGQNLLLTFEVGLFIASGSGILILVWAFPRRS